MLEIPEKYKLCTAEECRSLDHYTIHDFGVPGYTLMEIAGSKTAALMLGEIEFHSRALILCGKGNNAGDALVVARHLHRNGISPTILFISGTKKLSEDTEANFQLLRKLKQNSDKQDPEINFIEGWESFSHTDIDFNFIIDGMLGTGLNSDVRGDYAKAIDYANASDAPVFAIDIPTGLHADSGKILGSAIKAHHTFTYGALKTGFYFNDGPKISGEVTLCDLGFPLVQSRNMTNYLISSDWLIHQEKPSHHPKHKYDAGVLYIIAGSEGLTGAAMLAAKSAWAEGLGAVILINPRGILSVFENNLLHHIKKPVGTHDDLWFKKEHVSEVLEIIQSKKGKILLGPGLGRHDETKDFVEQLLTKNPGDMVIDADGLWALSRLDHIPQHDNSEWILTPHPGELHMLTGATDSFEPYKRLGLSNKFAAENKVSVVSKGMPTIISTTEEVSLITAYDTTIFARAGFGDVLSGKIAAGLTLGYSVENSCALALLNGKNKYDQSIQAQSGHHPEPADLI